MLFIDKRCTYRGCAHKTGVYRMVGRCVNCGTENILVMFTEGHRKGDADCPVCGVYWGVKSTTMRLATPDEIPVA